MDGLMDLRKVQLEANKLQNLICDNIRLFHVIFVDRERV